MRILVGALCDGESPSALEMSHTKNKAFVEADIAFSPDESALLYEFLGYYPDDSRPRVHKLPAYALVEEFLTAITVRIDWMADIHGEGSQPQIWVTFPRCGFELYGSLDRGKLRVSHIGDPDYKFFNNETEFPRFFTSIFQDGDPKSGFESFVASKGMAVHNPVPFSNEIIDNMHSVEEKANAIALKQRLRHEARTRDLTLPFVIGSIVSEKITHASSNNSTHRPFSRMLKSLSLERSRRQSDFHEQYHHTVAERLSSLDMKPAKTLSPDGSNMVRFLFTLKNSPRLQDRRAFAKIRSEFAAVFQNRLEVDVVLRKPSRLRRSRADSVVTPFPQIMFADPSLSGSVTAGQIGAGALQVLYLLTAVHGVKDSVVLLDEPGINLHPAMLETIMNKVGPDGSQILIITHSTDLLSHELFDKNSDAVYVNKTGGESRALGLDGTTDEWWKAERKLLKHQIDVRVFFSDLAVLVEGPADQSVLTGIAEYLSLNDQKYNLARQNIVVVNVGGKRNFTKYADLLDAYEIAYVILADRDDGNKNHDKTFQGKKTAEFPSDCNSRIGADIVLIEQDLERLLESMDAQAFSDARGCGKGSKVAAAIKFCEAVQNKDSQLCRFAVFLDYCIRRATAKNGVAFRAS